MNRLCCLLSAVNGVSREIRVCWQSSAATFSKSQMLLQSRGHLIPVNFFAHLYMVFLLAAHIFVALVFQIVHGSSVQDWSVLERTLVEK